MDPEARPALPAVDACSGSVPGPPLPPQLAVDLAGRLGSLADPARLRLVSILLSHEQGGADVYELSDALDLTEPTLSHHLKVLRDAGLVDCERTDVRAFYKVAPVGSDLFPRLLRLLADLPEVAP
ncbi:metalloregulator ArsR/SmtB family transcription factor [Nonomuraea sp. NPDC003709]|uniref:metalloregulator ArsR/SmtB family transcription factor n=1 Tax=Nonomuraea sp. NPDC003709 TaxID=3154450 RepID=UPI0033B5D794